jgi:hypothetical protein
MNIRKRKKLLCDWASIRPRPWPGSLVGWAGLVAQSLCELPATSSGTGTPMSARHGGCHPAGGRNPMSRRCWAVGEVATEDTDVEVDRLEAMGRGMGHHSGGFTTAHARWGGVPLRGLFGGCGGRLGVRGGAWWRWETHRRRGTPGWWLDE